MLEFFRSSAVRVALAFVLVTSLATTAVFALVYFQIGETNEARNRLILETEAAKSVNRPVEELRSAFEVMLTNDLRRIDYAALFDTSHRFMFGNIDALPAIPVDGKSHVVTATRVPGSDNRIEPAIFVALQRPDGNVMLLGRSLLETLAFRRIVQRALLAGLAPMLRKNAAVSRPLTPGPVKYSCLARKVILRCSIAGIRKWSENDRWLPAMIAAPSSGMFSMPTTLGRNSSLSSGPSTAYLRT